MNKRIGLVIHSGANLFSNGITQNAWFMYECLRECGYECEFLCNETDPKPFAFKGLMLRSFSNEFPYHEYLAIITITKSISKKDYDTFHRLCIPVISFVCGNHFMMDLEQFIHSKNAAPVIKKVETADAIWIIPSFYYSALYLETLHGIPVFEIPHLWSPQLLEHRALSLSKVNSSSLYFKAKKYSKFNIIIMEANISLSKNAILGLTVAEYIFKQFPTMINHVYLVNLPNNDMAKKFIENLSVPIIIQKTYKEMDEILLMASTDNAMPIFLCNQLFHSLNYVYYECFYYGYPLVHNSLCLDGLGYYYPECDIEKSAQAVLDAFRTHTKKLHQYIEDGRIYLERVNPYSKEVQNKWTTAITAALT
jgi:hypothetical protein